MFFDTFSTVDLIDLAIFETPTQLPDPLAVAAPQNNKKNPPPATTTKKGEARTLPKETPAPPPVQPLEGPCQEVCNLPTGAPL